MFSFLLGAAVGAMGYWAYREGMMPTQATQMIDKATSRVREITGTSSSQGGGNTGEQGGGGGSGTSRARGRSIVRPSAEEVATRPSEPIPGSPAAREAP